MSTIFGLSQQKKFKVIWKRRTTRTNGNYQWGVRLLKLENPSLIWRAMTKRNVDASGMLSAPQKAIPLHTGPGLHILGSNGICSVNRPSSEDVKPCWPRNPALVSKDFAIISNYTNPTVFWSSSQITLEALHMLFLSFC